MTGILSASFFEAYWLARSTSSRRHKQHRRSSDKSGPARELNASGNYSDERDQWVLTSIFSNYSFSLEKLRCYQSQGEKMERWTSNTSPLLMASVLRARAGHSSRRSANKADLKSWNVAFRSTAVPAVNFRLGELGESSYYDGQSWSWRSAFAIRKTRSFTAIRACETVFFEAIGCLFVNAIRSLLTMLLEKSYSPFQTGKPYARTARF